MPVGVRGQAQQSTPYKVWTKNDTRTNTPTWFTVIYRTNRKRMSYVVGIKRSLTAEAM